MGTVKIGNKIIPMRSPVSNFMYLLYGFLGLTSNANIVDTGNVVRNAGAYYSAGNYRWWLGSQGPGPGYGIDTWGIQVGSNATAVALTDYKLNTPITHGTGGGQLKYSGQSIVAQLSSGSNRFFRVQRYFTNDSGGDVTIREVGIVVQPATNAPLNVFVLIARDLTGDIVVTNTNAVPVEITWQVTA